MSAIGLILILVIGGLLAWLADRYRPALARWISIAALALDLAWLLWIWLRAPAGAVAAAAQTGAGPWLAQVRLDWIPRFGIALHFGLDGLSLLFCLLAVLLGLMAVTASWTEIRARVGFFHLSLLWVLAGTIGVFTALDLFLFFLFWELMLVPMVFVIGLWGHGDSSRAAIKFFLFTQGSGLLLLAGVLILVFGHQAATGVLTFDALALRDTQLGPNLAFWAMLGLFLAFAVKMPVVPLHTWLADAHSLAPTGGSVLLAGILLKTGGYAMIRFLLPLFPTQAAHIAPLAMTLGVIGIIYGALLAFAQTDIKRLVACSSISQMGFVLLGIFASAAAWNPPAIEGAVLLMLAHGISAAALFMVAGGLRERLRTLDSSHMGGLWGPLPRLSASGLVFAVATLGLPGFGNFVGEFLVLLGTFRAYPAAASVALLGLIAAAIYALALVQRAFHGPVQSNNNGPLTDLGVSETAALGLLAVISLWLGLHPQPFLDLATGPVTGLVGG